MNVSRLRRNLRVRVSGSARLSKSAPQVFTSKQVSAPATADIKANGRRLLHYPPATLNLILSLESQETELGNCFCHQKILLSPFDDTCPAPLVNYKEVKRV